MVNLDSIRSDESLLRRELESAGTQFRGKACRCPFHDDKHPSAGIYHDADAGAWKFKCQVCGVGGDIFDIRAAVNKTSVADEIKKEDESPRRLVQQQLTEPSPAIYPNLDAIVASFRNVQVVHKYTNPETQAIELAVIRWHNGIKKCFTQCHPIANGWIMKGLETNPIYNRSRLRGVNTVVVVEGEKCVEALQRIGIIATTSPMGAGKAKKADWKPLAGKKCILWADNDNPGYEHMQDVQNILSTLEPRCLIYRVDASLFELEEGGDVADLVERYSDKELAKSVVLDALEDAKPVGAFGDYVQEIEEVIAGKRQCIPFQNWRWLSDCSRALLPGTVTCIFGPPGCSKSFMMIECLAGWIETRRACVYMLEENRTYHLRRAHAQIAGNAVFADNIWVEKNPEAARESTTILQRQIDEIGRCIWDAPNEQPSYEMLVAWVEARAKDGFEVIVIDPVTAASSGGKPWIADQEFIFKIKTLARQNMTRVILVTHPRKSQKPMNVGLDDMAGGAAFQRFSQTVLLIEANESSQRVRTSPHFVDDMQPNRIVKVAKARNGPGAGRKIAFDFDHRTLRFNELGIIEKELVP